MSIILQNYLAILNDIADNTKHVTLSPKNQLVAVTKNIDAENILHLLQLGHRIFGENKVQEAETKWHSLKQSFPDIRLHLIGPLQSNKVKKAVQIFDVIETINKEKIATLLAKEQQAINKNLKYYIQVNTGEEEQKSGIAPAQTLEFFQFCKNDLNLDILGLMCIATQGEASGLHFALLKKLADRCNLKNLSMGMSQDYKNALQMGATSIRIGSAIFGARS